MAHGNCKCEKMRLKRPSVLQSSFRDQTTHQEPFPGNIFAAVIFYFWRKFHPLWRDHIPTAQNFPKINHFYWETLSTRRMPSFIRLVVTLCTERQDGETNQIQSCRV